MPDARVAGTRSLVGALLLASLVAQAGCGPAPAPLEEARRRSFVILGLDGAAWEVLDPLLEAGELPTLAGLIVRGARAELRAESRYALSGPSWTTIASGKRAARHGITSNRGDPTVARFWDIVGSQGRRSLVLGWVLADATRPVEGWLLSGPFAEPRSQPPDLLARLEAELGPYQPDADLREVSAAFVAAVEASSASQLRYLAALLPRDDWAVAAAVIVAPDRLQHFFWKYHEPEAFGLDPASPEVRAHSDAIRGWWRRFDAALAGLLEEIELERRTLLVVSDHGFQAAPNLGPQCKAISIDYVLRAAGWLALDRDHRIVPEATRVRAEVEKERAPAGASRTVRLHVSDAELLEPVRALFAGAVTERGARCFDAVRIEAGEVRLDVLRAADLRADDVLRLPLGSEVRTVPLDALLTRERTRSGTHTPRGILVAAGAGVRRGVVLEPLDGAQVTPTLLAALGIPLARDMDGAPATALFEPGWLPAPPPPVETWDDRVPPPSAGPADPAHLEERLRGLGYVQ